MPTSEWTIVDEDNDCLASILFLIHFPILHQMVKLFLGISIVLSVAFFMSAILLMFATIR